MILLSVDWCNIGLGQISVFQKLKLMIAAYVYSQEDADRQSLYTFPEQCPGIPTSDLDCVLIQSESAYLCVNLGESIVICSENLDNDKASVG